jgi:hypothetical protein
MSDTAHIEAARERLRERAEARSRHYSSLRARATSDAAVILDMIVKEYGPERVYQWGSPLLSDADSVATLVARVEKTQVLLSRIEAEYRQFLEGDFQVMGRKNTSAIVVAELMVDYYTCAETLFLRVSQFFENDLDTSRWHADLLDKMTLRIEGLRDPVIGDQTARWLVELMKFRHFRRYYFELEYDWDKLDYLQKVFDKAREGLPADLEAFKAFLRRLAG